MEFIIIDGKRMTTVDETHRYLERTLRLPPYYGHNLDALYDCLSDLSQNVFIILINGDSMQENLGEAKEGAKHAARRRQAVQERGNLLSSPQAYQYRPQAEPGRAGNEGRKVVPAGGLW